VHAETIEFYDNNAAALSAQYDSADMGQLYRQISRLVPVGGRVLEIGCGSGRDSRKLSELGYEITACDASRGMIEVAKAAQSALNIDYLCKSFPVRDDDPILLQHFDLVLSVGMIMHLPHEQIPVFVEQASAMLAENGIFMLSWCNRKADDRRLYETVEKEYLCDLLKRNSFDLVDYESTPDSLGRSIVWHQVVARKVGRAESFDEIGACGVRD